MKDKLEKFITDNKDKFNGQEPHDHVWHGIENSLSPRSVALWNSVGIWRAAAVILLGVAVYLFISREPLIHKGKETIQAQTDFTDQELFYRNQIAEKIRLINNYDAGGEHELFTQDFRKLDAMYQVLSEEMKAHPDKKVADAMILNLLVRVDLLNQQLKKLEDTPVVL